MRYKSIRLINYIGIYNGMKINDIYIDFTKCKNNLIVIKGDNGSGKSTLFKAINLLSDDTSSFIPGKSARKIIEVIMDDFEYRIDYRHEFKNESYTSKGYFYKGIIGTELELCNPNGNITACKDIIFSEFNLDSNFSSLAELSSGDRGIVSKIPSMRKQNFNSIISGVEIYNQIYKTLSKRSSVFKSMINSITTKIRQLGDEEFIKSSMISINQRICTLEATKDQIISLIAKSDSIISMLDPNGQIQESYDTLNSLLKEYKTNRQNVYRNIIQFNEKYPDITPDTNTLISLESSVERAYLEKSSMQSELSRLIIENDSKSKRLNEKKAKLESLTNSENYETLKTMKSNLESDIKRSEEFFKKANIEDRSISSNEYVIGLDTLLDIKMIVDNMRDTIPYEYIVNAISMISIDGDIIDIAYPDIESIKDQIDNIKSINNKISMDIIEYNNLLKTASNLINRPDGCIIPTCYFIKDAIEAASKNPQDNINRLEKELADNELLLLDLDKQLQDAELITDAINYISQICRYISTRKNILNKLPNAYIFSDINEFMKNLTNGSDFHEISDMYKYISEASMFEQYHNAMNRLESINSELKIYEAKNELLDDLIEDINKLDDEVNTTYRRITEIQNNISSIDNSVVLYNDKIDKINTLISYTSNLSDIDSKIDETNNNISSLRDAINQIQSAICDRNDNNNKLISIRNQIQELTQDYNQMQFSIKQLTEYKAELEEFNAKYEKIEFIKKCSSPTKGIQLIFIELYLRDIINTANQLLSLVMGGEFSLLKPVIDDRSFNFPCIGNGLPHDDISSLSDGQSAIMSVVLSSSIMFHSSTKYNILKFDEVDGQLDLLNRSQFLFMINQVRTILNCEQCIIITHNDELDLRNTDLVILRNSDEGLYRSGANIIYSYSS